ncbi:tetratricopeptide repeat protein [Geomonas sp. RF6]|uniref:tetratricopeptide repeat protein n=1 Tax=Geomonas sp. RF6 TaxID=2897342 RepID=UPI001E42A1B8|nr:tetratricopeptide repeat protein [Geomonas sp. RF6]UFS70316.1 tetratricopeptide repeat protein [Geomonas sp. RF6]
MKPLSLCIAPLLGLFLMPRPCHAHPETGLLPDAIAEVEYRIVLDITPNDLKTRNRLGVVLCRKNKIAEAEREYATVLRMAPNDFDAHDGMGLVRLRQRRYDEALSWFKKAISLCREDSLVHRDLGNALEGSGRTSEALAAYREGIAVSDVLIRKGINREAEITRRAALVAALQNLQEKIKSTKVPQ